ncbi:MAG TPA: aldehyde dehydrogenase family protein, partial [Chitinophagaceae bacterium]|nr:aldehyde dehydrogenase family protein [Chitinophagaceae bacterium]
MQKTLKQLNILKNNAGTSTGSKWYDSKSENLNSISPVDGKLIATVKSTSKNDYEKVVLAAQKAFIAWRQVPAPKRGEVVRQIGDELRKSKQALGELVSY